MFPVTIIDLIISCCALVVVLIILALNVWAMMQKNNPQGVSSVKPLGVADASFEVEVLGIPERKEFLFNFPDDRGWEIPYCVRSLYACRKAEGITKGETYICRIDFKILRKKNEQK